MEELFASKIITTENGTYLVNVSATPIDEDTIIEAGDTDAPKNTDYKKIIDSIGLIPKQNRRKENIAKATAVAAGLAAAYGIDCGIHKLRNKKKKELKEKYKEKNKK